MTRNNPTPLTPMVALAMKTMPYASSMPWIGVHKQRPYAACGLMILLGEQSDIYSQVSAHRMDEHIAETIESPTNSQWATLDFDGVPDGLLFCYSCFGTGEHNRCCFQFCVHDHCTTCKGLGWVVQGGRWEIQVHKDGPYVDAGYLRLALLHLGTHKVGMGTSGATGPVVLSGNGKYAVLMPLSESGSRTELELNSSEPATAQEIERWCYSEHEEEFWTGDCETREDAIAEGRAEFEGKRFFTGLAIAPDAASYAPSIERVHEEMHESAYEDCGSDTIDGWPRKDAQADAELSGLLATWARKHHTPTWFGVSAVQEHAQEGGVDAARHPV